MKARDMIGRTLYPEIEPYESGMLDVGDGHSALLGALRHAGRQAGGVPPRRPRRPAAARTTAACSTRRATTSCCSTSAAAAARRRNAEPGGQHHLAPRRRHRAAARASSASTNGRCSAAPGARRWRSPMPRPIPSASANWCLRGIFLLRQAELDWFYQYGASRDLPDKWERFLAPIPEPERGDMIAAYHRRLTGDDRDVQRRRRQARGAAGRRRPSRCCPTRSHRASSTERRLRGRLRPHREPLFRP